MDKKQEIKDMLLDLVKPGQTIYTIKTHASGVSRAFAVLVVRGGEILNISEPVARLLDYRLKDGNIYDNSGGIDAGFYIVYALGQALFQNGYALKHRWV